MHLSASLVAAIALAMPSRGDDAEAVPPAYAPFEALVGGWKGQGIPAKNRLKGWPERHSWAWKFSGGKPVGMTLEVTGGKVLAKAELKPVEGQADAYRLAGTDPSGKPVAFKGTWDGDTSVLALEREGPTPEGPERLEMALNEDRIRYGMKLLRKAPGAPQFAAEVESRMGKEGEAFAAGGAAENVPKCIVTGGAGTMTVSYEGKSYPICCSGCRDEFNDNPAKYIAKYLARGDKDKAALKPAAMPAPAKPDAKAPAKPESGKTPAPKPDAAKAAGLLAQGQALEKSGKTQAALNYYRQVAKDFPDTPAAKTARDRIKALGG